MKKEILYKIDLLTGEKFTPNKISQKFACPANRIKYNNMKAIEMNRKRAFFDGPCQKSHRILIALYEVDPEKLYHQQFLIGKGVDFSAYNNLINTNYGRLPAYYNYALRKLPNTELYQIIKP